jgi:hypothetical protein
MTETRFKFRLDKTCRIVTWSVAGGVAAAGALLWWLSPGEYLPVWFAGIVLAVGGLALLSAPRSIRLRSDAVEIRCVVEITHIPYHHIRSVKLVERSALGLLVPVFASPGFLGWYGYWLAPATWDFFKIYATSWQGLVMIEDVYEQRYVVSSDRPRELCRSIEVNIKRKIDNYQLKIQL